MVDNIPYLLIISLCNKSVLFLVYLWYMKVKTTIKKALTVSKAIVVLAIITPVLASLIGLSAAAVVYSFLIGWEVIF